MSQLPPPSTPGYLEKLDLAVVGAVLQEIDTNMSDSRFARGALVSSSETESVFRIYFTSYESTSPIFGFLKAALEGRGYTDIRIEESVLMYSVPRVPAE